MPTMVEQRPSLRGLRHIIRRLRSVLRRIALMGAVLTLLLVAAAAGYVWLVDLPPEPRPPQASVLYYRDGITVLARVGVSDRTDVPLAQVPLAVQRAFVVTEDRDFYHHHGIALKGVLRAVYSNVFDGTSQGASTITQQYVRNAYLTQQRTVNRKLKEAALALKIERTLSKDQILQRYLNTIYFGRNAYGIEAAAEAYFGLPVNRLDAVQGAVLAALVKDPYLNDPEHDRRTAELRWRYVMVALARAGWFPAADAQRVPYPRVARENVSEQARRGPLGLIADRVEAELHTAGVPATELRTGGLRVTTTIDAQAQQAATSEVTRAFAGQPANLRVALVAVDPRSGGVRAYYGGSQGSGFFDDATAPRPPAATFKPVVLAQAISDDISVESHWDGRSPRQFPDRRGVPVLNRGNVQCPVCSLSDAMQYSLNTPYYALTEKLGADRVRELAVRLGVSPAYGDQRSLVDLPGQATPGRTRADISLGEYPVSPADLAGVYATFAAGGIRSDRHVVDRVAGIGLPARHHTRVLAAAVASDITGTLIDTAEHQGRLGSHPAALKTGSQPIGDGSSNSDSWVAQYTPQLAAVLWVGRATPGPIRDARRRPITGDGLPLRLARTFMDTALAGRPLPDYPRARLVGDQAAGDATADPRTAGQLFTEDGKRIDPRDGDRILAGP